MARAEPKGCLSVILSIFGIKPAGPAHASAELPYRLRDDFLSPAELSFYRVLRFAVKEQAIVFAKVNLADIFFVVRPNENQSHRNKIDRKHVDFLICNAETMKPLVGLELDDKSHEQPKRVERDEFVDAVFEAADLPLIHVTARAAYEPNALIELLAPHLSVRPIAARVPMAANPATSPICPKCGTQMVERVASKGPNAGKKFWGCQNYPKCREVA